jgi:hypothetical protein
MPERELSRNPEQALRDAMEEGRLVPFIGAGISQNIRLENDQTPPSYYSLVVSLLKRAEDARLPSLQDIDWKQLYQFCDEGKYLDALEPIEEKAPELHYTRWVRSCLRMPDFRPAQFHGILKTLEFPFYITPNYDRVLERILEPSPEVLTYKDLSMLEVLLEQLEQEKPTERTKDSFIFKIHGDITRANEIVLAPKSFRRLYAEESELRENLKRLLALIFRRYTLLFLGMSFLDAAYLELIREELAREPGRQHFALLNGELSAEIASLLRDTNIKVVRYTPDPDKDFSQVWEYLAKLKPSRLCAPPEGMETRLFFLLEQRPQYLEQQRIFEEQSTVLRYATPEPTNALVPENYVPYEAAAKLERYRENVDNFPEWKQQVIEQMLARRRTVLHRLARGYEVRVLCAQRGCEQQIKKAFEQTEGIETKRLVVERYLWLLDLLDHYRDNLVFRMAPIASTTDREESEKWKLLSFASLCRPRTGGEGIIFPKSSDVAVAFAAQATTNYFSVNMMHVNSSYAELCLIRFEREWAQAKDEISSVQQLKEWFPHQKAVSDRIALSIDYLESVLFAPERSRPTGA